MRKWEISLLIGVVATIVWCAASPRLTTQWWTSAFSPLCGDILCGGTGEDGIVLRSKFWELLQQYAF